MFSVIFDMDGTLTDTQRICIPAWDYAGELQGFKNMGAAIPQVCGMSEEGWTSYLIKNYKGLDYLAFKKAFSQYIIDSGVAKLKQGAMEILNFLKENNVKMAIASGSPLDAIKFHLGGNGIFNYFEVIVTGDDVTKGKPDPEPFLTAAKRLGVSPKDCFVFEDSSNGIISGYRAGMRCIGVADIVPFSDEAKKMIFREYNSLDEAIPYLKDCL